MANTSRSKYALILLVLLSVGAIAIYLTPPEKLQIRWNDETLYYAVAKNIFHDGDFNSCHYLAESLLSKGYPTKDTHPPGYPLFIAASFLLGGANERAPLLFNYALTEGIVLLLLLIAFRFQRILAGILAAILFLLHPLTLSHTQSMMSEISAAFTVTLFFLLLAWLREGWIKGLVLAATIALAALIKPFLWALLPAALVYLALISECGRRQTCLGLLVFSGIFFLAVVRPLTSPREYYPSSINDLFLRPGIGGKWKYALENFGRNIGQVRGLKFKDGEAGVVVTTLIMLLGAGAALVYPRRRFSEFEAHRLNALLISLLTAFSLTLAAVFFLYEFNGYRGSRAIYCFLPFLGFIFSAALFRPGFKMAALALTLPLLWVFYHYSTLVYGALENSKRRQTSIIQGDFTRTDSVLTEYGLRPRMVMSKGNLLLPARRFPTRVIWSEPKNLREFDGMLAAVKPDVLELSANSPLFLENFKISGNPELLGKDYRLFYRSGNFYYYQALAR